MKRFISAGIVVGLCLAFCGPTASAKTYGLVIDCSPSMLQRQKIRAAKEGAKLFASILDDGDELIVVGFQSTAVARTFKLSTSAERQQANQWIDELAVSGGTDYVAGLRAANWPEGCALVFLSDGEHQAGPAAEVVNYVRSKLGRRVSIHAVAVECDPQSGAEQLLRDMATATKGSVTRVENSEALVKTLVQIAVRIAKYRSYAPGERLVRLQAAGRLLAFAYDGTPVLTLSPAAIDTTSYEAELPGEDVSLRVARLAKETVVDLALTDPKTPNARWGEIHRDDLAVASITVDSPTGIVAGGETMTARIGFKDREGRVLDPKGNPNLSGKIAVTDEQGKVVERANALPSPDSPTLAATFTAPRNTKSVTVHAKTTVRTPEGQDFVQLDQVTLAVEQPITLAASPDKLSGSDRVGTFSHKLVVTAKEDKDRPLALAARLDQDLPGLSLVSAVPMANDLVLTFSCERPGTFRGQVVVSAVGSLLAAPLRVPFQFEIQANFLGLLIPKRSQVDLGTRTAGSGLAELTLAIPSGDDEVVVYDVESFDLVCGSQVLPLRIDGREVRPTKATPAVVHGSVDVSNVAAGNFVGRVRIAATVEGTEHAWVAEVLLVVTEPLASGPIQLGVVEVSSLVDGKFRLKNLAGHRVADVSIAFPSGFTGSSRATTDDIVLKLPTGALAVEAQATRDVEFQVAVSPLLKELGEFRGNLLVRRGTVKAVEIPIRLTIVPEGQGPAPFHVSPEKLEATGDPGEVLQFPLRIRTTTRAKSSQRLTGQASAFIQAGKNIPVVVDTKWARDNYLHLNSELEAKLFLITPSLPGTYRGEYTLSGELSGRVSLPIEITVQ